MRSYLANVGLSAIYLGENGSSYSIMYENMFCVDSLGASTLGLALHIPHWVYQECQAQAIS